jgi:hypothetical protein
MHESLQIVHHAPSGDNKANEKKANVGMRINQPTGGMCYVLQLSMYCFVISSPCSLCLVVLDIAICGWELNNFRRTPLLYNPSIVMKNNMDRT